MNNPNKKSDTTKIEIADIPTELLAYLSDQGLQPMSLQPQQIPFQHRGDVPGIIAVFSCSTLLIYTILYWIKQQTGDVEIEIEIHAGPAKVKFKLSKGTTTKSISQKLKSLDPQLSEELENSKEFPGHDSSMV